MKTMTRVAEKTTDVAPIEKRQLTEQLSQRYSQRVGNRWHWRPKLKFLYKKYAWLVVITGSKALKRVIDIVGSTFLLIALAPLFLLIALLVKLTDRGPILFWQQRVGRWGREFDFPKFRSMIMDAEKYKDQLLEQNDHGDGITFKMKRDPRITWIGRILRKLSLDELPQLWSVLCGHMSLVGPRPPVPREVALYSLSDRRRLEVKPGLTCIWQVSGRSNIPFPQQVELDALYIDSQSLLLDIKLLCKTIPAVLLGRGAY